MNIFPTNILVICNTTMCIFQKVVKIKSTSHYLYSQKLNIFAEFIIILVNIFLTEENLL